MIRRVAALCLFAVALLCGQVPPAQSLLAGKQLYLPLCSRCHGMNGEGGLGPDLRTAVYWRAPDNGTLVQIISVGIPGTDMPRQPGLTLNNAIAIAGYVRTLGQQRQPRPPGNEVLGEEIYRTKGKCAGCHSLRGKGGALGPDLTAIGRQRSVAYLRTAILEPDRDIAEANVAVRVTAADGRIVSGVRVAEDTFTIRVRDSEGKLTTFDKGTVKIEHQWQKSPMPSYRGVLTNNEVDDLAAYLTTRVGDP